MLLKTVISYILIGIGVVLGLKTLPLAVFKMLYSFNMPNTFGLEKISSNQDCAVFAYSVFASDFFLPVFTFSVLLMVTGLMLLVRRRSFNLKLNYINIFIIIAFLYIVFYNFGYLVYIYLLMAEDSLFNSHIIYLLAFVIACLIYFFVIVVFVLIWFDLNLKDHWKIFYLILIAGFSQSICFNMLSFIYLRGIIGENPDIYIPAYEYILAKLGLSAFCMNENSNPCGDLFKIMQKDCYKAQAIKKIPRIPNGGGPASSRWISRFMNIFSTGAKVATQHDCNEAKTNYHKCAEFMRSSQNRK